jgi:hypothetical protein
MVDRYWEMGQQVAGNIRLPCSSAARSAADALGGAITAQQLDWIA